MTRKLSLIAALLIASASAHAQVPSLVQYQGRLLDALGNPVVDGSYGISLRFYDGCVGGTLLLTDTHDAVVTRDGIYSLVLGGGTVTQDVEADLQGVFTNHDIVCLGVTVDSDLEMIPRQRILSAGYAMRAAIADSAPSAVSEGEDVLWTGAHIFQGSTTWENGAGLSWPHTSGSPPPNSKFHIFKLVGNPAGQSSHPNGEADEQFVFCYNCDGVGVLRDDLAQHSFNFKFEETYFDGTQEFQEHNWNFENVEGFRWRPFGFRLRISGFCSMGGQLCYTDADCGGGETCESHDEADFTWTAKQQGLCRDDHSLVCTADSDCPTGTCREDHEFRIRMDGRAESKKGIDIEAWTSGNLNVNNGENALKVVMEATPANTNGLVRGISSLANFNGDSADSTGISSLFGIDTQVDFSGDASSRTVTSDFAAVRAIGRIDAIGGTGNTISRMSSMRSKNFFVGDAGTSVGLATGLLVSTPVATGTVQIQDYSGIWIEDLTTLGTGINAAIAIDTQGGVGSSGDTGNIRMNGGGALDGHIDLGGGHLWMDSAAGTVRFKQGVPTGDGDGTPIHSPAGTSAQWGGTYWGDSTSASHDSGDEVCALADLSCLETYDMGSATAGSCSGTTHATPRFLALCH